MKKTYKPLGAAMLAAILMLPCWNQASAQVITNVPIASWANDVMSGYDNGSFVVNGTQFNPFVGNINDLPGRTRLLLKFDISAITGPITFAEFNITSFGRTGNNTVQLASYNSNQTNSTFTSTDIASSLGNSTAITTFQDTSDPGLHLHWGFDITSAVQTAKTNGYSYVSFLLYSPTANAIAASPFDSNVFFLAQNGGNGQYDPNINVTTVPEPSTWAMLSLGLMAVLFFRRRQAA